MGTFGSGQPTGPIDRVYASSRIGVDGIHVATNLVDGVHASDHAPVVVDYRLTAD